MSFFRDVSHVADGISCLVTLIGALARGRSLQAIRFGAWNKMEQNGTLLAPHPPARPAASVKRGLISGRTASAAQSRCTIARSTWSGHRGAEPSGLSVDRSIGFSKRDFLPFVSSGFSQRNYPTFENRRFNLWVSDFSSRLFSNRTVAAAWKRSRKGNGSQGVEHVWRLAQHQLGSKDFASTISNRKTARIISALGIQSPRSGPSGYRASCPQVFG